MKRAPLLAALCVACGEAELELPVGFQAHVFADEVGVARHITVAANGDVFVAMEDPRTSSAGTTKMRTPGGVLALRDTNRDGRADVMRRFGTRGGSGIALRGDTLYFSTVTSVFRYRVHREQLQLDSLGEVTYGFPNTGGHSSRSLALDSAGNLYVNVGSDGNVCNREPSCGELNYRAGIWRVPSNSVDLPYEKGEHFATGIRNAVGLAWNPRDQSLYATQHGRDGLDDEELPAEELLRVSRGDDYGWPYCYYDALQGKRVTAPEYGGDGRRSERCASFKDPIYTFPAHWAPNGLLFYEGSMFPAKYRSGVFIAFHGSWNRGSFSQDGYRVVFWKPGERNFETFADGFAGRLKTPSAARHRPVGLAEGPDGALYITDDQRGRIWKITAR